MTDLLRVENLGVAFGLHTGETPALRDVSFRVRGGSTMALVGESGSGKSTVARAIMGLLPGNGRIVSGRILLSDTETGFDWAAGDSHLKHLARIHRPGLDGTLDLTTLDPDGPAMRSIRGGHVAMIFQDPMTSLSPLHTVGNQITDVLDLHTDLPRREHRPVISAMLELVGFADPARALDLYPFELSGGMRQRAMIAMSLIAAPGLLIADEPTSALDVTVQAQILKLIRDLQARLGMAVMLITHDLGVVAHMADEVVVLYRGEVMESGPVSDIYRRPGHPYLRALFRALPRLSTDRTARLVPLREVRSQTAHLLADKEPWPAGADDAGPLLRINDIHKTFTAKKGGPFGGPKATKRAVNGVSLEIRRGDSLGLVGESGCGKTTIGKIIMRAITPESGSIRFNDRGRIVEMLSLNAKAMIPYRRRIQYIFQDPSSALDPRMTVFALIAEPLKIHGIGDKAFRIEMVKELMTLVGLDQRFMNRYPHSFSGGQKQRIGIARALALKPDLVMCDEPVSALDVVVQAQVLNLLKDLQHALGLTYLFVSHNMAVVRYMCNRIAVMCMGRVVEEGPTERVFEHPVHPYTRALLAAVPDPDGDGDWLAGGGAAPNGGPSDPEAWPAPYAVDDDGVAWMRDLGGEHRVLVGSDAAFPEIAA